jgi:gliding motility-associated-like protein
LEFSPDDSKLYGGGPVQYDLTNPTQGAISTSETLLTNNFNGQMAGLQMGLDGKIYGNHFNSTTFSLYMDCIHNPNALGVACNYQDSAVYLEGKLGGENVPQFLPNFFKINFYVDTICLGEPAQFNINFTFSVFWNFGDPSSGALNTDTAIAPTHVYNTAGTYTVMLIAQNGVRTDTVYKTITVKGVPQIDLGEDKEYCKNDQDSVRLSVGGLEGVYAWSNGSSDSSLWVSSSGVYSLTFTDECGADTDAVELFMSLPLSVNLPPDTMVCADTMILSPQVMVANVFTKYLWKSGETAAAMIAQRQQPKQHMILYGVTATNACGSTSDSLIVTFLTQPDGFLPADSTYCSDIPFYLLNSQSQGVEYLWPDASVGPQFRLSESGTYWLQSASLCDTLIDSFTVRFVKIPKVDLGKDSVICPGDLVRLKPSANFTSQPLAYRWNTDQTDSVIWVSDTGIYSVTVTLDVCRKRDSIYLGIRGDCYDGCKPHLSSIITPNADGVNDAFHTKLDCALENYELMIYNRWGVLVFQSYEPGVAWDGNIGSEPASDGTYFYVLSFWPKATEQQMSYRGYVQLIR